MQGDRRRKTAALGATGAAALVAGIGLYRAWVQRSGAASARRVGYAPLATPKPLDDGLWIVDDVMSASGLMLPIRMTVVRLAGGDLLLHSPTPYGADLARQVEALGTVRHLVAPTFAHWTHLAAWQRAYPEATSWGVPNLRDRAQVRRSGTRIDRDLAEEAPPEWRDEIVQGLVLGGRSFRECYFFHKSTRTLLLSDIIENLEPGKLPPVTRAVMSALRGTRSVTGWQVRAVLMAKRAQAKRAIDTMLALEPQRVVFGHGDFFADNGAARLRLGLAWLTRD